MNKQTPKQADSWFWAFFLIVITLLIISVCSCATMRGMGELVKGVGTDIVRLTDGYENDE